MSWLNRWRNRRHEESDLDREVRFHFETHAEELEAQGVNPVEARRRARLAFGGPEHVKEECRDERRGRWIEDFVRDCRYGLRILRRSPVFTCAAVLSLALGIGANTAIFSLMDLVMLRMMPVQEPERLVQLAKFHPTYGCGGNFSWESFQRLQRELRSFDGFLGLHPLRRRDIRIDGQEESAEIDLVSGSYFPVLGVGAVAGRTFGEEVDGAPGASPVAVISHGYWRRRFALDPAAIGRTFQLRQTMFTIVGVAPPEFFGTTVGRAPEILIPLSMDAQARGGESWMPKPSHSWLQAMGRLRDGTTIERARAEVDAFNLANVTAAAEREPREARRKELLGQRIYVEPAGNGFSDLRENFSEPLAILMGVVALVLLIACANIANLLLSKAAARQREMAVRLAIGGSRLRIVRQLLTEGMLLAAAGGALGVALAYWLANALVTMMSNGGPRMALTVTPDLRVLTFAVAVSVLASLLFSLAPAIQATRRTVQPALSEARASRWRLGKGLIVAQVAISLMLLIGAGLFGRTLLNIYTFDAGFERHGVLTFGVNAGRAGYSGAKLIDLQQRLLTEIRATPGVAGASVTMMLPISGGGWDGSVFVEGYTHASDENDQSHFHLVGPGYFKTLGTPVLQGREFTARDRTGSTKVVVVNEAFARYYFRGRSPIGTRLSDERDTYDHEIVGVVKDMKYRNLRQQVPRTVYFAAFQSRQAAGTFVVRTAAPPASMRGSLQAAVDRVDRALRIGEMLGLDEHVARSVLRERMLAALAGFFGLLALVLASVGIYGVMAFQVARRRREIGIRIALGARPGAVIGMVLGQVARLVIAGAALGIAAALGITGVAEKLLFGVAPTDPLTFALAAGALAAVAIGASYLPGRVASRLNPVETLRAE